MLLYGNDLVIITLFLYDIKVVLAPISILFERLVAAFVMVDRVGLPRAVRDTGLPCLELSSQAIELRGTFPLEIHPLAGIAREVVERVERTARIPDQLEGAVDDARELLAVTGRFRVDRAP